MTSKDALTGLSIRLSRSPGNETRSSSGVTGQAYPGTEGRGSRYLTSAAVSGRALGREVAIMNRHTQALIAVAALVVGVLGPIPASLATAPGLSGTVSSEGHTLTWATGGVSAPTGDLVGTYDGVVQAGATVTFNGSATFSVGHNAVTNLSQSGALTGATSKTFSQRVYEGTYAMPFNLTATAPGGTGSGVLGSMTASTSSRNCNDSGVCAGPSISLKLAVVGSGSPSPSPTPSTKGQIQLRSAAYRCMKQYMIQAKGNRFYKWTRRGSLTIYRNALISVEVVVNPAALSPEAEAQYLDGVITLRRDPRTLSGSDCLAFGNTMWEEVSHSIEDAHGDVFYGQSYDRRERRVDYMIQMDETWQTLARLEKDAREGASAKALAFRWKLYLKQVERVRKTAIRRGYTPDHLKLKEWFGWDMYPKKIRRNYLTGKFLPGPAGEDLRKALRSVK